MKHVSGVVTDLFTADNKSHKDTQRHTASLLLCHPSTLSDPDSAAAAAAPTATETFHQGRKTRQIFPLNSFFPLLQLLLHFRASFASKPYLAQVKRLSHLGFRCKGANLLTFCWSSALRPHTSLQRPIPSWICSFQPICFVSHGFYFLPGHLVLA